MAGPADSCRLIVTSPTPLAGIEACWRCPADEPHRMMVRTVSHRRGARGLDWRSAIFACDGHQPTWYIQILDVPA